MKKANKIIIGISIIGILIVPIFRQPYHIEGIGEVTKYDSIVSSIVNDYRDGTRGTTSTAELVYTNIVDRGQELINIMLYGKINN